MDYMCHVCAVCFDSNELLRNHIQDERSRLIRDIQALCTKPYLPVSSALGIIVRYATHADDLDADRDSGNSKPDRGCPGLQPIRTHDGIDLTCPESFCRYESTAEYQDLQRHYRMHIACDEACPFCSRPLTRVSHFVRHPDECADRKKRRLRIPDTVSKRQKTLSVKAYNELRLAQRRKNQERQTLQGTEPSRRVETDGLQLNPHAARGTGISSIDATLTTHNSLTRSASPRSTICLASETGFRITDHGCSQAPPPTAPPASVLDNSDINETTCSLAKDLTTLERIALFPADVSLIGAASQRAPTLSNSLVDGGTIYPGDLPIPEMDLGCLSELFPIDATHQRAPTLSNSLIDGALAYTPGQYAAEEMSTCLIDLSPPGSATTQRAPTLTNSLVDGQMIDPSGQYLTEGISPFPRDLFSVGATDQRVSTSGNSRIDGALAHPTSSEHVTIPEGVSMFQLNPIPTDGTAASSLAQDRPDLSLQSNDMGQRATVRTSATGDGDAASHYHDFHTSTPEGIAAYQHCLFPRDNGPDPCSTRVPGTVARNVTLSSLDVYG